MSDGSNLGNPFVNWSSVGNAGTSKSVEEHVDSSPRAYNISTEQEEDQSAKRSVFRSFTSNDVNGSVFTLGSCVKLCKLKS